MTTAIYAGSFDPVHLGHMNTINEAARRFSRVHVVVAANSRKEGRLFSSSQRVELLTEATAPLPNVSVAAHAGLIVEFATQVQADILIRTFGKEHHDEAGMAYLNLEGGFPTVFLPADRTTGHISSSAVRALVEAGELETLAALVPKAVVAALKEMRPRRT